MGGVILIASIVIWFLSYFPRYDGEAQNQNITELTTETDPAPHTATASTAGDDTTENETQIMQHYLQQRNSYIGQVGRFIEPVMRPLGFDWETSVALVTGAAAKEVIVSTLGVLHAVGDDPSETRLGEKLKAPNPITNDPGMTMASALSLLVFVLLYFPCIAAVVAIARETGSWKWALFSFVYNTGVAWILSFIVYNISSLFI